MVYRVAAWTVALAAAAVTVAIVRNDPADSLAGDKLRDHDWDFLASLYLGCAAMYHASGGRSAWIVDGEIAKRRDITLGATSASEVEVVRGLEAGDRIIVSDTTAFGDAKTVLLR